MGRSMPRPYESKNLAAWRLVAGAAEKARRQDCLGYKDQPAAARPFIFSMMAVAKAEVPTLVAPGIKRSRS